jgi:hypothetical protein
VSSSRTISNKATAGAAWLALLCPALAGASDYDIELDSGGWLGLGVGAGKMVSAPHAPSADRSGFAISLDGGYRFNRQWGLGLEFGVLTASDGCDGLGCTSATPGFAPNFLHWFAVGEYRPPGSGWRLRGAAGLSSMCYRWYKSRASALGKFVNALLGGNDPTEYSISCNSLKALGVSASVGYQWRLRDSPASLGVQLRGEAADFSASAKAGTQAFHHRGVTLQLQLSTN